MRKVSRRFPNGVTVWVEKHSGGTKFYTATRNGRQVGFYAAVKKRGRVSFGKIVAKKFFNFYDWLRAAREVG